MTVKNMYCNAERLLLCVFCDLVISPTEAASLSGPSSVFQMATPALIAQWRTDKM